MHTLGPHPPRPINVRGKRRERKTETETRTGITTKTRNGTGIRTETDIETEMEIERGRKRGTDIGTETRTEIPVHRNTRRRRSSLRLQRITRRTANCTVSAKRPTTSQSKLYGKTSTSFTCHCNAHVTHTDLKQGCVDFSETKILMVCFSQVLHRVRPVLQLVPWCVCWHHRERGQEVGGLCV